MGDASRHKYRRTQMSRRLGQIAQGAEEVVAAEIEQTGMEIAEKMKAGLVAQGSIDTGALRDSIRAEFSETNKSVRSRIYADATSDDGQLYYEFVEYGTGVYNEHGDGRQTPWKWQDRDGNWHTTTGYQAKPFIRPAVNSTLPALRKSLKDGGLIEKKARKKKTDS